MHSPFLRIFHLFMCFNVVIFHFYILPFFPKDIIFHFLKTMIIYTNLYCSIFTSYFPFFYFFFFFYHFFFFFFMFLLCFYHVLSCFILFYPVLSCFIMVYHVLWCFIMFFHVLSCFIMFYHVFIPMPIWSNMLRYPVVAHELPPPVSFVLTRRTRAAFGSNWMQLSHGKGLPCRSHNPASNSPMMWQSRMSW